MAWTSWGRLAVMGLVACTGEPSVPRNPGPLQLAVRVAEARHADRVDQDIFVWPKAAPSEAPDEATCLWWSGDSRGRDVAARGLHEGSLRWAALVVTREGIDFGGERVVSLDGVGRLPEDASRDGLIPALGATLREARGIQDAWYDACGLVYRDRPLLVVDQAVPMVTVGAVLRTLSHHRFPRVAALVGDREPENRSVEAPEDPGVLAVLRPAGDRVQVMDSLGLRRQSGPQAELESMLAKATPGARFGCALLVPETDGHWRDVAATIDTVTAFGAFSALVHPGPVGAVGPAAEAEQGRAPTEWLNLDGMAAVHWLDTPVMEDEWGREPASIRCDQVEGRVRQRVQVPASLTLALSSVGEDPVQPCFGPACVPFAELMREEDEDPAAIQLSWLTFGPLEIPETALDADGLLAPLYAAMSACDPPVAVAGRGAARAVGWVEVDPEGRPFDVQIGVLEERHKPWASCLGQALRSFPTVGPPAEGQHALVQLFVDAPLVEAGAE